MARRGFFRRVADAVTRVFDRFTEPEAPAPRKRRRLRRRREPVPTGGGGTRVPPTELPSESDLGPDWQTSDWLELDPNLIDEVFADLLADMDAGGYF